MVGRSDIHTYVLRRRHVLIVHLVIISYVHDVTCIWLVYTRSTVTCC